MILDRNLERIAKSIEGKEGKTTLDVADIQFLLDTIFALKDQVNIIEEEVSGSEQDESYDEEGDCTNCFGLGCTWCE